MKKILRFLGFNGDVHQVMWSKDEKKEFSSLFSRPFNDLNKKDQERALELAAKDFSRKFAGVIKDLSRE